MTQTSEKAFETHAEEILLQPSGRHPGANDEWDVELALYARNRRFVNRQALCHPGGHETADMLLSINPPFRKDLNKMPIFRGFTSIYMDM